MRDNYNELIAGAICNARRSAYNEAYEEAIVNGMTPAGAKEYAEDEERNYQPPII